MQRRQTKSVRTLAAATCVSMMLHAEPAVAQRPPDSRPSERRAAAASVAPSLAETADWLRRWLPQIGGMTRTARIRGPRWDATSVSVISLLSAELERCVFSFALEVTTRDDGGWSAPFRSRTSVALDALEPNTLALKNLASAPPFPPIIEQSAWWTVSVAARGAGKPVRSTTEASPGETEWRDTLTFPVQDENAGVRVKSAMARALTLCTPSVRREPF